ncbi:MAG: M1 family metallopeptidase [Acidobacteriota bacterium]
MKRLFALTLLFAFVAPALSDDYPRSTSLNALHYRIRLELKDSTDEINGETEILFAVTRDSTKELSLDLSGMTVAEVKENSRPAKFTHVNNRLSVALEGAYRRDDRFTVSIKYRGVPRDGLFIKKNKFGDRTFFADNWPNRARHWFPSIDHPYDKASAEFFVTAPDRYDVVANGALIETKSLQNGSRLWHWRESAAIPTYCMVIGAAEFSIINVGSWNNTPVVYYLYPKDRDRGMKDYGRAVEMLEFYSNLIGPYPYEKLALVQSSTRFGGMENSSSIFFDEKAFNGSGALEGTVAHEIAHQWFGDSVTESDWHHLWLSEGFATYFGHLFFERRDGRDKFLTLMRADRESLLAGARPIYDPSIKDLFQLLNSNNYQKGGWVLHMLRGVMGDEKFFAAIRDYYRLYRDGNALTEDFQRAMELHYEKPLDWFFRQWIYEPGYPVYDAAWRWDEATKEVRLIIAQKQTGTIFRMPMDVEIRFDNAARRFRIEVSQREEAFSFKLDARPHSIAIDTDEWVLKKVNVREEK